MLAPNPTNRLHCQHSPTARFESKRAAHQAQWEGVNFGRRSPSSGGQNCTPNNSRVANRGLDRLGASALRLSPVPARNSTRSVTPAIAPLGGISSLRPEGMKDKVGVRPLWRLC
jgi:hypothetical protein